MPRQPARDRLAVWTYTGAGEEIPCGDPSVTDAERAAAGRETLALRWQELLDANRRRAANIPAGAGAVLTWSALRVRCSKHDQHAYSRRGGRAIWLQPRHVALLRADRAAGACGTRPERASPIRRGRPGMAGGAALPAGHWHADRADAAVCRARPRRRGHPRRTAQSAYRPPRPRAGAHRAPAGPARTPPAEDRLVSPPAPR